MKIDFNPVVFGAKIVKHQNALRYDYEKGYYVPQKVFLAQIDTYNEKDINGMVQAVRSWNANEDYGERIVYDAIFKDRKNLSKFYVLTTQRDNLDNLKGDKILGMAETSRISKKTTKLDYIQVNPKYTYLNGSTDFFDLGKSIIKGLQQLNKNRAIKTESVYSACGFYEKMGFELIDPEHLIYLWKRMK